MHRVQIDSVHTQPTIRHDFYVAVI